MLAAGAGLLTGEEEELAGFSSVLRVREAERPGKRSGSGMF